MVDLIYIAEFEEQKVVFQYFNDCCVNTEQFLRFASFHPTYMFWDRVATQDSSHICLQTDFQIIKAL